MRPAMLRLLSSKCRSETASLWSSRRLENKTSNYHSRGFHSEAKKVVVLDGVRTPFCTQGGILNGVKAIDLAGTVIKNVMERNPVDEKTLDCCVFGTMVHNPKHLNITRDALAYMGYDDVPAITVTNHCASSLSAVMTGYAGIQAGSYRSVIVGGVESMSGVTIYADEYKRKAISKFKQKTNILELINYYLEHVRCLRILEKTDIRNPVTRKCVYNEIEHLGGLMDEACSKDRVFETGLDMLKYAHQAQKNKFLRDLVPFESDFVVDADEFDFEKRAWEMLRPDFKDHRYPSFFFSRNRDGSEKFDLSQLYTYLVSSSLVSHFADGAAANLLMEESEALRQNLSPKAFIRDVTVTGNELKYRSRFGVLSSMALLLSKNSLFIEDISVLEIHENSAVEMLFLYDCIQDPKKLVHLLPEVPRKSEEPFNVREICNTWGGSLAFGHPFGATGVRLITTACNRLHHDPNARYAVVSMTSYGGTGISILLEKYT